MCWMNDERITGLTFLTLILLGPFQQCPSFLFLLPAHTPHLPSFKDLLTVQLFQEAFFQPVEPFLISPAPEYSIPGSAYAQGTFQFHDPVHSYNSYRASSMGDIQVLSNYCGVTQRGPSKDATVLGLGHKCSGVKQYKFIIL